eukprot:6455117-Amphidinium_carterae.1
MESLGATRRLSSLQEPLMWCLLHCACLFALLHSQCHGRGASSGLGLAAAKESFVSLLCIGATSSLRQYYVQSFNATCGRSEELALGGEWHVIMACRDFSKAEKAFAFAMLHRSAHELLIPVESTPYEF